MRKTKLLLKTIIPFVFLAALLSANVPFAAAVSDGGVSVFPANTQDYPGTRSWFVYEAEPGTTIQDKVDVINNSNKTVTLLVAALDGAVTGSGGYTLVGGVDQNKDLGTWVTLEKEEVTLPPKTSETLKMTVEVPENADVGSHPGGIVIWRKPEAGSGAGTLSVITRVAARLYLTVPGDIKRILEVENVHHQIINGVLYFRMTLHNKGNVQLTPIADITLRGLFGKLGTQSETHFGLVLRGTTITSRSPWQGKMPTFGRYVASFRIHYGEKDFKGEYIKDEYIDVKYVFWIIPWLKVIIGIGILIALIFIRNLWLWLVIQQRLNIKTKKHKIKKGETLTAVANLHDIHPKKIAKFNLLKWPYDLSEGDVLLIPVGRLTREERLTMREEFKGLKAAGKLEPVIIDRGDTLKDVAEFAGISIKEVIAINHLRWPYRLRAGQELLVPSKGTPAKAAKETTKRKARRKSVSRKGATKPKPVPPKTTRKTKSRRKKKK